MPHQQYEIVVGLEMHAQLQTNSKLFCGDGTSFGAVPNTHVSAISLAHPGTLPVLNQEAVRLAVKLGLALNCTINQHSYFERKNYFYPDLPKGYQISQQAMPVCVGGAIPVLTEGEIKKFALNRIHLEEDAGKSIHDVDPAYSLIDLNRAGTPLVEIVTEPVLSSADEAAACLSSIRAIVRRLGVCDGNMEEGSLRCDVNISARKKGDPRLGTKVEIKNLNSVRNVKRAISFESQRLFECLAKGEEILQQTRSFNADNGTTTAMRTKEEANDYRYFPDPDLPPVIISEEMIDSLKKTQPLLPCETELALVQHYGLSSEAASIISNDDNLSLMFEASAKLTNYYSSLSNWLIGPVKNLINEAGPLAAASLSEKKMASLASLTAEGQVAFATAATRIFPEILIKDEDALTIAQRLNLLQVNDTQALNDWVEEVLLKMPEKVLEYKKGKKNLIGLFAGEVKKVSKGKADIKTAIEILSQKLNN